ALDGSREPVVVDLPRARELAIARDGAGFVVALRDEVGGVVVATIDAGGRTLAHGSLEPDPAFAGIAATDAGILGWRADHTILLLAPDGAVRARLAADAGQQLVDVASNGKTAVALVAMGSETGERRRARLVDVAAGKLAWGAWIDGDLDGAIALSPS